MPCPPQMLGCRRGCRHRAMVEEYRLARHAAECAREDATRGYATELSEYQPIITFKLWLTAVAGKA